MANIFSCVAVDYSYAFTSYLDESFDMKSVGLFAVGGLIAQGPPLFELARKWEALCKANSIAYFKASACERGKQPFQKFVRVEGSPTPEERKRLDQISEQFIKLVLADKNIQCHGITIDQKEFYETVKDQAAKDVLTSTPYRLAYDLAMIQCAWMMKSLREDLTKTSAFGTQIKNPRVSFVCDEHEQHSELAAHAYSGLKRGTAEAEQFMASYSYENEKCVPVLQAADAIVYIVRRSSKVEMAIHPGALPPAFKLLADNHQMGIIRHVGKENLKNIVKRQKPGQSYDLSDIMEEVFNDDIKFKSLSN